MSDDEQVVLPYGGRLVPAPDGVVRLVWDRPPESAYALDVARLAVGRALGTLGAVRLETVVGTDDTGVLRALSVAGLRREGIVRMPAGTPDRVLMARLVDDPEAGSRAGFVAMLNAGLPRKRAIAQGLLHDEHGRVLLCELTYKSEWDLPGGVVEPGESPALGLVRELREELGVDVGVRGLRTVNWLPAWNEWDDACTFVYDLEPVAAADVAAMTLQPTEIAAVHWCDAALVHERATAVTVALLDSLAAWEQEHPDEPFPPYREHTP